MAQRKLSRITKEELEETKKSSDEIEEDDVNEDDDEEKVDTNFKVSLNDNEEYTWIGFELNGKYYMGFESSDDLQAIAVSKKFFNAFRKEFKNS